MDAQDRVTHMGMAQPVFQAASGRAEKRCVGRTWPSADHRFKLGPARTNHHALRLGRSVVHRRAVCSVDLSDFQSPGTSGADCSRGTAAIAEAKAVSEQELAERRSAEQALRHERDLLRAFMDNTPDFIYFKDTASRFTRVNKALVELVGAESEDAVVGKTDFDFFPPEHAEKARQDEVIIAETGRPFPGRIESEARANGEVWWRASTKVALKDDQGHIVGVAGISRDITQQVHAEAEREEQRRMLRTLLDALPDIIIFKDRDSVFQLCNKAACEFYNLSEQELIGKTDFDFFPPETAQLFRAEEIEVMKQGRAFTGERRLEGPQRIFWEEVTKTPLRDGEGNIIGVLTAGRDVGERKGMEADLVRAQKLESVGLLAGGIAHDFNNLLTAILGNISLGKDEARVNGMQDLADTLDSAEQGALRAAALTRQLLTFSKVARRSRGRCL